MAGFAAGTIGDFFTRQAEERATETAARSGDTQNTGGDLSAASAQDGKGGMSKLVYAKEPKPPAAISFVDDSGQTRGLADWKGKFVLLNLWATWCAPCKQEMPGLDRLQAKLGGADFAVVPVSLDRNGPEAPRKFLASIKVANLPLLLDTAGTVAEKVGIIGLPATLILNREGREVARLVGPAEWDSPAAEEAIRGVIAGKQGQ